MLFDRLKKPPSPVILHVGEFPNTTVDDWNLAAVDRHLYPPNSKCLKVLYITGRLARLTFPAHHLEQDARHTGGGLMITLGLWLWFGQMVCAKGCELRTSKKVLFIYILMFVPVNVHVHLYMYIYIYDPGLRFPNPPPASAKSWAKRCHGHTFVRLSYTVKWRGKLYISIA